jgi:DNA polymerase (family 10)
VDILVDGRLDYEDAVLKELDFVVASPHVSLKQETDKATDRILRAIDNKYVHIIGHPTGRLINSRAGLPLDFSRVFKAAAASGTVLEINAGYPRLDLNDVNARGAIDAGVMLAIDTDAHSTQGLGEIGLGISVARRAWATKENVINCMGLAQFMKFIVKKR